MRSKPNCGRQWAVGNGQLEDDGRQAAIVQEALDLTRGLSLRGSDEEDLDTDLAEQREEETEQVVDQASAARTVAELSQEIVHLKRLERLSLAVRRSGEDSKWVELSRLLYDRGEMFDPNGRRRKLVIFSEHRDTLNYLVARIGVLLGRPKALAVIHGGMGREERRLAQARFTSDPDVSILVATDAAGEGINLQRAHLMVNYGLPWNPNRLEQRFGRIHRFGQREVCHCWNLVAYETREGQVFGRLLEKLEIERQALGGKVFDVLGRVFDGESLRDLFLQAIRYGDDPATRAHLEQRISEAMSDAHYRQVLDEYALVSGTIDERRLRGLKDARERAEQQRLVPHFIAAFFVEAFAMLGGAVRERERGRYEIRNVPAEVRRRDRLIGRGAPVLRQYERIAFDRDRLKLAGKPDADFVAPGHPLLDAVIDLVIERHRGLLRRGAVLVDPRDEADQARALFYIRNDSADGTSVGPQPAFLQSDGNERTVPGAKRLIGRRIHFVEIDDAHSIHGGRIAPYLDYRTLHEDELPLLDRRLQHPLASEQLEHEAIGYAVAELVPEHLNEVKAGREALIRKTMAAVKDRLVKEINYWDMRAEELRVLEQAGRQPRRNSMDAAHKRDDLTARLQERMLRLEQERQIAPQSPVIIGGALILPQQMLDRLLGRTRPQQPH
ncbi:MAG: helicase-related protein, partial [Dehalococcoidia bacterium]